MIREIKWLLGYTASAQPSQTLETQITTRIEAELQGRRHFFLFGSMASKPQRGRRLATALALSCVGILSIAVQTGPATLNEASMMGYQWSTMASVPMFRHTHRAAVNAFRDLAMMGPGQWLSEPSRTLAPPPQTGWSMVNVGDRTFQIQGFQKQLFGEPVLTYDPSYTGQQVHTSFASQR